MRHQKIQEMLSLFVDGRLSSTEQDFIYEHLKTCDECRTLLTSFKHLSIDEPKMTVNPFFATRVLADLKTRQNEKFWNVFDLLPRPVIVTGLVLSIITLAIFATPYSPIHENQTSAFAMLYGDQQDVTSVTDDRALEIAINANAISTGE